MDSQYLQHKIKELPDLPGVYQFLGEMGVILYIGRATSLRDRVKSYFSRDLMDTRGPLVVQMIEQAKDISFIQTDSVLEAVILEANLIKKHQPKHNSQEKDDKSFNFTAITDEDFPRVLVLRGRQIFYERDKKEIKIKYLFGPFPNGGLLREALRIVRKIFPFRDKCAPFAELLPEKQAKARGCFNYQIGLCPGVCAGKISKNEYAKTIRHIRYFFEGRKKDLIKILEKEMKEYAKAQEFEKAGETRKQIFALNHIQDIALVKSDIRSGTASLGIFRIEAYDIAHMSGENVVGVMTVLENGEAKKSDYRKFKIKRNPGVDDTGALLEVLERRFKHSEWLLPNIIVVDGGVAQKNTAESVIKELGLNIPVLAVTKNDKHKPEKIQGDEKLREKYQKEVLLANAESHRFAIGYHKLLRKKGFEMF